MFSPYSKVFKRKALEPTPNFSSPKKSNFIDIKTKLSIIHESDNLSTDELDDKYQLAK